MPVETRRITLEVEFEVTGDYEPFVPARTWGRPEDCYPAEGGTFSIYKVQVVYPDDTLSDTVELPARLLNQIEESVYEEIACDYDYEDA